MNRLEIALVTTVLKESLEQIAIANCGRHIKCVNLTKKSINNRFKEKVHESVYHELDPFKVALETLEDIKLQKDINFLETVLSNTAHELIVSNTWHYLKRILETEKETSEEERELLCEYTRNTITFDGFQKRLGKKLNRFDMRLRLVDEILADVKNDFKNIKEINAMELSLVQRWEQTRYEQARLVHEQDERELAKLQKMFTYKTESEQRLIYDVETFNSIQTKDYEQQIKQWQKKYNTEFSNLNERIQKLSLAILKLSKKHERHREISQQRQQFIDDYKEQKERERLEYEMEQKRIESAIKIQAWWRGVMVRRHLGPYRRKKKGKKGGKKQGK